ncbi:CHASE2 domain-containing protein [Pseudodesulfovibrio sediminis]|uniref:Adenylate/guanylate cyclase domain-containing protein n=1 Tax=Pseudodesulfovibrio sediminis TaxID=2810563 RepID=A0ABN6EPT6_9BACT|nr:adenylate/guanylate cyclase domain-containing protein [Pseudodesulfovibrio sediminis]BCS87265.1 adenylate/guanylate cyclase domain-containing protein [Pseudodesulfovibrio sediminis]
MLAFIKNAFKKDQLILLASGLAATFFIALIYNQHPHFLQLLNLKIYDQYLKEYHQPVATHVPVIIDIDEKSLAEIGQWPWPRYQVAKLMKYSQAYGAVSVASDIIFSEPDRTSPITVQDSFKKELGLDFKYSGLPAAYQDNDVLLGANLKTGPFVLGMNFIPTITSDSVRALNRGCFVKPAKIAVHSTKDAISMYDALPTAEAAICPLPVLAKSVKHTGFITTFPDPDSVYRRVPLLYVWHRKLYPSLAMAALMQATGVENITIRMRSQGVESIRFNKTIIPTDKNGRILINYRGPTGKFEYFSASDILKKRLPMGALQGKIAFIGTSASGLKDMRATPLDPSYPGVEVHATLIDNILSRQFLVLPDWATGMEFMGLILAGITTTLLLMWARATWMIVPLVGMAFAMFAGSAYLYKEQGYFISPLYSYLTLAVNFTLLTLIKFWREENAKKFIHGAFAHYLAPSVIGQIMDDPDSLTLEGQEKDITIQFSDVRSFTSLSEKLSPTQVTNLLHDYLTPMTRIITNHDGTLDKFIGDAVMAFWNAPLDVENHQECALNAALAQQIKLEELNELFLHKYGFTIAVGIGIHSGPVRVGNMGSADLFDYTLIGDNVNLASRLEGLTKYYGQKLIVSQTIKDACGDNYYFRILDNVRVKGKKLPVTIYTAYPLEQAKSRMEELELYEKAHAAYLNQNFNEAKALFVELQQKNVEPLLYDLYIERCELLIQNPPDNDWDGVFVHKTK